MSDAALLQAYQQTTYWVAAEPRPIGLRIGARHRGLDRLLVRRGAQRWAFVTAWNPGSTATPGWRNARYQRGLASWLKRRSLRWLPGVGEGDDPRWPPEPSVFVLQMSEQQALRCGRRFRQNAVVVGRLHGRARLFWCWQR